MTVIGCVWGAHREVVAMFAGRPAPSYDWCEAEWLDGPRPLRKVAPAGNALPEWLRWELWSRWRQELAQGAPERCRQMSLFEVAS